MEDRIFAPERFRRLLLIFLCTYYVAFALSRIDLGVAPSGSSGDPKLLDFYCFWAAGRAAILGEGARVYDYAYFLAAEKHALGYQGALQGLPYVYPPHLLLYLAPLGLVPVAPALTLWLTATFAAAWAALRRLAPWALLVLFGTAPSAMAFNLGLGQTSLLITALLGLSLELIAEAPLAGGLVLGLLTYKPQFGVIIPIVLVAGRQWRVLFAASLSTAGLMAVTAALFGPGIWLDFYRSLAPRMATFQPISSEIPISHTVYGFLIWLDCPTGVAKIVHLCVVVPVVIIICKIWRRPVPYALKAASLGLGALIATPYLLEYDLVALAVPVAFLLGNMRRFGVLPGERFALLAAWLILFVSMRPVGVFALAIVFAVLIRRAVHMARAGAAGGEGPEAGMTLEMAAGPGCV